MIWFFIAGFISGAVGMLMFARWFVERHMIVQTDDERDDNEQ